MKSKPFTRVLAAVSRPLLFCTVALSAVALGGNAAHASQAYGTINNFDTVNDTGHECHGFEIEIEGVHSTDVSYTYDWNHYGKPKITDTGTSTIVRYESAKNPDSSWAAFTAIPAAPILPTQGHQFTNPSVNFGGEHFGVGYRGAPTAVKYNWLIDDGAGNLIHGGAVQVATPVFAYSPPAPGVPAAVQAVIAPPPPPAPEPLEFGKALWVKEIRTTTHNNQEVGLRDLVDPGAIGRKDWRNGEPDEVEVEWQILQTDYNAGVGGGANGELAGAPEDLPNNDEIITRRYEFYTYTGPLDTQTGEAMAQSVAADGKHGVGIVNVNGVDIDLSTIEVVGKYQGAQMSAFDLGAHVGLIDHLDDGEINTPYPNRLVVIAGNAAPTVTSSGKLPAGLSFDNATGILSGTPTESGVFSFTVNAQDANTPKITKTYTLTIVAAGAALAPRSTIDTSVLPAGSGTSTGDGPYDNNTNIIVTATPKAGYVFSNWTDNTVVVSSTASYSFNTDVNRSLVANFIPAPLLNLSINDASITEGNVGSKNLNFTVTLSQLSASPVTVDYATANGTNAPATAGSDYTTTSGTLTIPAGKTTGVITVPILGDTLNEANETFFVNLSNAKGAPLLKAQGLGTIIDDDPLPILSSSNISVTEGTGGTKTADFTITLSAISGRNVGFTCYTADGTAHAPSDYTATRQNLTIPTGQTTAKFSVPLVTDSIDEVNETFFVFLTLPVNAKVSTSRVQGTILNDDAASAPVISIDSPSVKEGNVGLRNATFHINLSKPSGKVVTVTFTTSDRAAAVGVFPATANVDYKPVTTTVSVSAGKTVAIAHVAIIGDTLDEENETFGAKISNSVNGSITAGADTGICTIIDDDTAPALSISDVKLNEGNSGTTDFTFNVTLTAPSAKTITVKYATADGMAKSTSDYAAQSGTLTFAPGVTTIPITVKVNGDTVVEPDETFFVLLSGATNVSGISKARGVGTIVNDDASG